MSHVINAHAIRLHQHGGPEVLQWEMLDVPAPGAGEVRIQNTAVGLNYIDTYHRSGAYKIPLPSVIGREGAGFVESIGAGVTDLAVGDRVAYASTPIGAYAQFRIMPAVALLKFPRV
jgi:NADPH:quinone reductase